MNSDYFQGRTPRSAHPSLTPCQLYKTADSWLYLMCNKEDFWPKLCRLIDRVSWIEDERFQNFRNRLKHRELLTEFIDDALSTNSTADWLGIFQGQIPAAPVLDLNATFQNPFLLEGDRIQDLQHQSGKSFKSMRIPIRSEGDDKFSDRGAPELGEHTEQLLQELGFGRDEISELRRDKIV